MQKELSRDIISTALDPKNPICHDRLATTLAQLGRDREVLDSYRKAAELGYGTISYYKIAKTLCIIGEYNKSLKALLSFKSEDLSVECQKEIENIREICNSQLEMRFGIAKDRLSPRDMRIIEIEEFTKKAERVKEWCPSR